MQKYHKKKTVIRSIRLNEDDDLLLQREAQMRGLSYNSLVNLILKKFIEWDRFAERLGMVSITRDGFQIIHESIKDELFNKIAEDMGSRNPKDMTRFWFKEFNLNNFLNFLSLYCKYGRLAECEIKKEENEYYLTFQHAYGEKYSKFLSIWLKSAFKNALNIVPKIEVSKNSVSINFKINL
jgi:hypothetical protein